MVPYQSSAVVPLGWGEEVDVGGLHHLVGTSPINPTAMFHAGYVIRKCLYACSYLLFISLIIFFSLPAITVAFNVSHSTPTQCGPFQVSWNDPHYLPTFILPLNDRPVTPTPNDKTLFDNQTMTYNFTITKLPLKTGTQFVVLVEQICALFSSPVAIYRVLT